VITIQKTRRRLTAQSEATNAGAESRYRVASHTEHSQHHQTYDENLSQIRALPDANATNTTMTAELDGTMVQLLKRHHPNAHNATQNDRNSPNKAVRRWR
jgi:hypothetical protein